MCVIVKPEGEELDRSTKWGIRTNLLIQLSLIQGGSQRLADLSKVEREAAEAAPSPIQPTPSMGKCTD